jgi:hypothetical protein
MLIWNCNTSLFWPACCSFSLAARMLCNLFWDTSLLSFIYWLWLMLMIRVFQLRESPHQHLINGGVNDL